jgi:para-nitrobenzyl esterase
MNQLMVRRKGFTVGCLVAIGSVAAMLQTATGGARDAPAVTLAGGRLQGALTRSGGAVFKGIPYAQPPVAELRWREPAPAKPWSDVRDATKFGAPCMQGMRSGGANTDGRASEDCLFLNVWTSKWPSPAALPVMVEIHGGGHYAGSSSLEEYDGESLAQHGIVFVSINYRLGVFGLFAHPELTRESRHHASGNQGLLDQIAALRWIRENISAFGGDPGNVTIFGQSSGSVDASALLTSPLTRGLFHHAIAQSGAAATALVGRVPQDAGTFDPRSVAEAHASDLATALNVSDSLDVLRRVPASEVLAAVARIAHRYGVIVDGYVLPRLPAKVFAAGQEHRVSLITGNSARERIPGTNPPADLEKAITDGYGVLAPRALSLYKQPGGDPLYGTPSEQWVTDTSFRCSSVLQSAWHAAAGNPSYEYEFQRAAPGREAAGAEHTAETPYVFGTLRLGLAHTSRGFVPVEFNAIDERISDAMQRYWTNFARRGNPNDGALPNWPRFSENERAYLRLTDKGPSADKRLRQPFCDVYIDHIRNRLSQ